MIRERRLLWNRKLLGRGKGEYQSMISVPSLKGYIVDAAVVAGLVLFVVRYLITESRECASEIIELMKGIKKKWNSE